jgi:ABC-type Fe3+/spermidine/putrescine transport system ATPase subunit
LLRLERISKSFGDFKAIDDLNLTVQQGEVFALLGPSGCGKSTTLRQIAGLDHPDSGTISLRDKVLFSSDSGDCVPPQKRNMGMVFQSYAIWPHLSVFETVAYPLRLRRRPADEIDRNTRAMLRQVGLEDMADRPSTNLSGGQQQRVALARALVYQPDVLLLDEPFSNLDVKLREQMRVELKLLQRQVGVTVILVTHDQSEALSLSDRIAVMNAGRVEQVGSPMELYENPATPFVRDFIGQTTKVPVDVIGAEEGSVQVSLGNGSNKLTCTASRLSSITVGTKAAACIRPESVRIGSGVVEPDGNVLQGSIEALLFLGDRFECAVRVDGVPMVVYAPRTERLLEGQTVKIQVPSQALSLWPL